MAAPLHEPGLKQSHFKGVRLPALLLLPQLLILLFFFFIPAVRALMGAFLLSDPFGATVHFVWFDNFIALFHSESYRNSVRVTIVFTLAQNVITILIAGVLAFATDRVVRGQSVYKGVVLLPYAIAPAIAGVLWAFLFNPAVGPVAFFIKSLGFAWDPNLNGSDAMLLVVFAASWKHICYNYIFLLAGLLAIPGSLLEAAAVDGAGPIKRFFQISVPLLGPTIFFLTTMNFVYGFFETFAIIDAVTHGGPAGATNILVYKVYQDGFINLDLGSSAAQSVLLMTFALILTLVQFKHVERRVNYTI
ncbi:ABC transporter permease subunit [Microvirga brassicacearum]|uniref:sn-glycerol-3-phosphate transport system permease protein UgpA n=1 Tax=Microvirga brassicacearum TaxID=2580413 RepID=A0A5N3P821_9HYPH|nr:ABC transporter permease subunit [Microvirga brassicacearum]KAB0265876.1 ABC transporter permease subunit [Microvirga brassicacearum]